MDLSYLAKEDMELELLGRYFVFALRIYAALIARVAGRHRGTLRMVLGFTMSFEVSS